MICLLYGPAALIVGIASYTTCNHKVSAHILKKEQSLDYGKCVLTIEYGNYIKQIVKECFDTNQTVIYGCYHHYNPSKFVDSQSVLNYKIAIPMMITGVICIILTFVLISVDFKDFQFQKIDTREQIDTREPDLKVIIA